MKSIFRKSGTYRSDPDVQLMLAVQKGDRDAFEALMHKYYARILNFIYRFTGNREVAEDLTQEVFLRVYNSASGYTPRSRFQTWIYTIARNISLNELRRHKRRVLSLDETHDTGAGVRQVQNADAVLPDEAILHRERAQAVRMAIDALPKNQRMAVILRRYESFSYAQIAATMQVSEKAVKSLLSRAKQNLKHRLSDLTRTS